MVNVAVWDEDFGADDLIGSFSFDLVRIFNIFIVHFPLTFCAFLTTFV